MTVSAEAVSTGGIKQGDRVLVLGPGNIGQGVALFAREAGAAQVVIVGKDDALRLAYCSAWVSTTPSISANEHLPMH